MKLSRYVVGKSHFWNSLLILRRRRGCVSVKRRLMFRRELSRQRGGGGRGLRFATLEQTLALARVDTDEKFTTGRNLPKRLT
jgi:hypothetical protein